MSVIKGQPFTLYFVLLKQDGTGHNGITPAVLLTSTGDVSTNDAMLIDDAGLWQVDLTGAEMNVDSLGWIASTAGAVSTGGTIIMEASFTPTLATTLAALTPAAIATAVWSATTRTLTASLYSVADIASGVWGAVTRSLTDKSGFAPPLSDIRNDLERSDGKADIAATQATAANTRVQVALNNAAPGTPIGVPRTQDLATSGGGGSTPEQFVEAFEESEYGQRLAGSVAAYGGTYEIQDGDSARQVNPTGIAGNVLNRQRDGNELSANLVPGD